MTIRAKLNTMTFDQGAGLQMPALNLGIFFDKGEDGARDRLADELCDFLRMRGAELKVILMGASEEKISGK